MPTLLDITTIKARFPLWQTYCTVQTGQTVDDVLTLMSDEAEAELLEYVDVTSETIDGALTRHFMVLVRYHSFMVLNGGRVWEPGQKPRIVKDYEMTIKQLETYRKGGFTVPEDEADTEPKHVQVKAKDRRFETWFLDPT